MFTRRLFSSLLLSLAMLPASARAAEPVDLEHGFRTPPDSAKPWAYWWWLKGNVDPRSITSDLEAMKSKGFGGLLMFDARGYHEAHVPPPPARMEFMSPEWRKLLKFAMKEANRLGLRMSVNLSSCAGALKGPWDVGDDAPKKLVWATAEARGPKRIEMPLPSGQWNRAKDIAVFAARRARDSEIQLPDKIVDLADKVNDPGQLAWDAPPGEWTVLRFAYAVVEGHETDVDILCPEAVERYFHRMGRALLDDAGPLAATTLTHFYSVSWEGAAPTWTPGFERYFERACGYDPRPYLPALAGFTVGGPDVSQRFLRDYHRTLADCFRDHCYGTLRRLCAKAGLTWHSESGGPWDRKIPCFRDADQLAFLGRNDMPQGEFWHLGRMMNRPSAMAAHIYGRPLAAVEAFTHMQTHWSAYPATLKGGADTAFTDGANFFIWHTFTASPPEFGKPGFEYFAGTHINPNVTWFEQSGDFIKYLARCQFLLQQGKFVADVCCYTGDKPYLHWGRGAQWSAKAGLTLPSGYSYDLVNTEVLLDRLAVSDGRLVLPDGMSYRLLVLDLEDATVPPAALRKILALAEAGATIVLGPRRAERTAGLRDYPKCDREVAGLADQLWGTPEKQAASRRLGKGTILSGMSLNDALDSLKIAPDFIGPCDFTHRRTAEADIYFLAGRGASECTFRASGKEPELFDPVTGRHRPAVGYRTTDDGRTLVPLVPPEGGSTFVVFRKPMPARRIASVGAPADALDVLARDNGARLTLWRNGHFAIETSPGKKTVVDSTRLPEPQTLAGPWEVRFAPGWGAPESIVFDRLVAWNEHPLAGIKYFSGTAAYRKKFRLDAEQARKPLRLQLGAVHQLAQVRVNGKSLGVVWTAPWTMDLSGAVKPGENLLEIDVTNLWVNRLIGDAALPPEKRLTKTNVALVKERGKQPRYQAFGATDPLIVSGLLGPVRLEFGEDRTIAY